MHISKTSCGISFLGAACLMVSCSDELLTERMPSGDEIIFHASVETRPAGRASRSGAAGGCEYLGAESVTSDLDRTLYVHTLINEDYIGAVQSRGTELKEDDLMSFKVSAYAYDGEWSIDANSTPNLIRNITVSRENDLWTTDNMYYWPSAQEKVRFYAYANMPGTTMPYSNFTQLRYTVNKDVTQQKDIIAAVCDKNTASDKGKDVKMEFHHILTGIRFRAAEGEEALIDYKVKSVSFDGIYATGTFSLKEFSGDAIADRDAMWTFGSGTATSMPTPTSFTIDFGEGVTPVPGVDINGGDKTLMMIPQTLSANAKVTVILEDSYHNTHTLVKTLAGTEWGMGQMVTYVISTNSVLVEDVFELYKVTRATATGKVTEELLLPSVYTDTVPHYNYKMYDSTEVSMTSHYRIRSYRKVYPDYVNGEVTGTVRVEALNYSRTNDPGWIITGINTHAENDQAIGSTYYDMVVEAQVMRQVDPWSDIMKERTADQVMPSYAKDDEDGYFDLSKRYSKADNTAEAEAEAEINTSNCYIVSAPGKYKFPVVYGNAIRHSKINYEAFGGFLKEGKDGKSIDDYKFIEENYPFVTSNNKPIKEVSSIPGYIYPTVENATNPKLIWSDYPEVVESVVNSLSISPSGKLVDIGEDMGIYSTKATSPDFKAEDERWRVPYVFFEIDAEHIQQGNMMIGFHSGTAEDQVNWSWHIWLTPFVPDNHNGMNDLANTILSEEDKMLSVSTFTVKTTTGTAEYTLLPYNLGWCNRIHLFFGEEDRSETYRFVQEETGRVIEYTVFQPSVEDIQHGNNLLYQWGRKDPLRGSYSFLYGEAQLKPFYKWSSTKKVVEQYLIQPKPEQKTVADVLKEPQFVYGTDEKFNDWNSSPSNILWRIPSSEKPEGTVRETDGKTIYDPSPVGHLIASSDMFQEFLEGNTLVDEPVRGVLSGKTYVSLCGYRGMDGQLVGGGTAAYYYASDAKEMLYFNTTDSIANGSRKPLRRVISGAVRPRQDRRFADGD